MVKVIHNFDRLILYTPLIPTGETRSRGFGNYRKIYVLWCNDAFKTIASPHKVKKYYGLVRYDGTPGKQLVVRWVALLRKFEKSTLTAT